MPSEFFPADDEETSMHQEHDQAQQFVSLNWYNRRPGDPVLALLRQGAFTEAHLHLIDPGASDRARCNVCKVELHYWHSVGFKPLVAHYLFSPSCSLLRNFSLPADIPRMINQFYGKVGTYVDAAGQQHLLSLPRSADLHIEAQVLEPLELHLPCGHVTPAGGHLPGHVVPEGGDPAEQEVRCPNCSEICKADLSVNPEATAEDHVNLD